MDGDLSLAYGSNLGNIFISRKVTTWTPSLHKEAHLNSQEEGRRWSHIK